MPSPLVPDPTPPIALLRFAQRLTETRVDPSLAVEGAFTAGEVVIPRLEISRHEGATALSVNIPAEDLGRLVRDASPHQRELSEYKDREIGLGLLRGLNEKPRSPLHRSLEEISESVRCLVSVMCVRDRQVRSSAALVGEESFLRIRTLVYDQEFEVDDIIDGVNGSVRALRLQGSDLALAGVRLSFPERERPTGALTDDEVVQALLEEHHALGAEENLPWIPPRQLIADDDQGQSTLVRMLLLSGTIERATDLPPQRFSGFLDRGVQLQLFLMIDPLWTKERYDSGDLNPAESIRLELEELTRRTQVSAECALSDYVTVHARMLDSHPGEIGGIFLDVTFDGNQTDDREGFRERREIILGHLYDVLSEYRTQQLFKLIPQKTARASDRSERDDD